MRKLSRLAALGLSGILALGLAACGGGMAVVADGRSWVGGASYRRFDGLARRRNDEREGTCFGGRMGRDRLHHAVAVHDDGPDPASMPAELRLTNRGLVDCTTFEFVDLVVE